MRKQWLYLFLVFITMLVVGILLDDARETLNKAIKICLECIGVG